MIDTRQIKPGLVALYDIRPGNGAGPFLQPRSPHGAIEAKDDGGGGDNWTTGAPDALPVTQPTVSKH